jgi:hypothetical protein
MARRSAFFRSVAMIAATFILASCGDSSQPDESPLAPPQADLVSDALNLLAPPPASSYKLITEPALLGDLDISKLIGLTGGTISIQGITLTVPSGALSTPTLFTVLALPTNVVDGSFTAIVSNLLGLVTDVGGIGFKKPVTITMSYARATNVKDPSRLFIVYYDYANNRLVKLPSTVNTKTKTVSAQTDHFSKYGMAEN